MADHNSFWSMFTWGKIKAFFTSVAGKETAKVTVAGVTTQGGGSLASMLMFGGFGIVSAISNQIEYLAERKDITNFYREELAAKDNDKAQTLVNDTDLTKAEKTNETINEAVVKERNFRNVGIAASFIASVAVYALMNMVVPTPPPGVVVTTAAFLAKVALGGLAYLAVKSPLTKAGINFLGLNKENTHDLILGIAKDRENAKLITREQVVEVFIAGNQQLSDHVEDVYNMRYHELPLADKVRVASEVAGLLPIDKIVTSINVGSTKASELAFTVQGDISGVLPKKPKEKAETTKWQKFAHKCKTLAHSVGGMFKGEKAQPIPELEQQPPKTETKMREQEQQEQQQGQSPIVEFNHDTRTDHTERYMKEAEARATKVEMPGNMERH